MYRVLIADDESASLRFLQTMIENYAQGFALAGQADNGIDALRMLGEIKPDLLLADIRMPGLDGVELAKRAHALDERLLIVMVSGYSEFEYARGALEAGAEDYLLKPLNLQKAVALLNRLREKLDADYSARRKTLLTRLLHGHTPQQETLARLLPQRTLALAIGRRGNLPAPLNLPSEAEPPTEAPEQTADLVFLPGRDVREWLAIHIGEGGFLSEHLAMLRGHSADACEGLPLTLAYSEVFDPLLLHDQAAELLKLLDDRLVIGLEQVIRCSSPPLPTCPLLNEDDMCRLQHCLTTGDYARLKELLFRWACAWETACAPQRQAQVALERIAQAAVAHLPASCYEPRRMREELAEIWQVARSMGEVMAGVWDVLFENSSRGDAHGKSNQALAEDICEYVRRHCADPLTVQAVCAAFGVSPTFLSRLFRRYGPMTIGEYVTHCRVELSKSLIREYQGMKLKDIALCAGYEDPSYFTKVFQKQMGISPSQYAEQVRKAPN